MKKRIYRAANVNSVNSEALIQRVKGHRLAVNVDVAKSVQFASLMLENKECLGIFKWDQLKKEENRRANELLRDLCASASSAALVMEPSGTYGDPLRHHARAMGFSIHRVGAKRCRDYAEVYDGVPSQHDGKSAILLGRLHLDGISEPWCASSESRRDLSALVKEADIHQSHILQNKGRLEGWTARHWPELHQILPLSRVTVLELLAKHGSPLEVARAGAEAERLMKSVGGHLLRDAKIESVMRSARETMGVPPSAGEIRLVQSLAGEILRSRKHLSEVEKRIEKRGRIEPSIAAMEETLGLLTAVVLFVEVGDPRAFPNVRSYVKAAGLNLKERSSGQAVGRLMLSKRGSGMARKWLYMAALRLIQRDRLTRAWYEKKVLRDGGKVKMKAVGAVMRKLTSALWHVAQGNRFDPRKLFDARRLSTTCG